MSNTAGPPRFLTALLCSRLLPAGVSLAADSAYVLDLGGGNAAPGKVGSDGTYLKWGRQPEGVRPGEAPASPGVSP